MPEYRVTWENSQDMWLYHVEASWPEQAIRKAQEKAEQDGWNGMVLGEYKVERL